MNNDIKELIKIAMDSARNNTCCKYSNFTVGAALLTKDKKIYKGFNIENDGIQSICAERVALANALTNGAKEFLCIVVTGKNVNDKYFKYITPCGYCRQFIQEYVDDDFIIYTYDEETNNIKEYKINELLPYSFDFKENE